jgi:hypothetical protein
MCSIASPKGSIPVSLGRIRLSVIAGYVGPVFSASDGIVGVENVCINGETE